MKMDLQKHINNKNLLKENQTVVIALSGGIDSMVLLSLLLNLNIDVKIVIAHVNHNKREASKTEYSEIENIALNKNIIFEGIVLDDIDNGNFHDESRKRRYDFFVNVAKKHDSKHIFLAHHLNDQIETIVMRLIRGTSFSGYSGIKETTKYNEMNIVRPLLDVPKDAIIEYAKANNITFFEDSTNVEPIYTRNRIRKDIVPTLVSENNNAYNHIKQFSTYIEMADENLNKQRDMFLDEYFTNGYIDIKMFLSLDQIIKFKVLKFIINSKSYDTVEISFSQYNDMIDLLHNENPNISYNLSKGYILVKEYERFYVDIAKERPQINIEINSIGEYILPNKTKYVISSEKLGINHTDAFELCYNDMVFPLFLRNREIGDRMTLNVGTKKIKDILIDKKVPANERENLILLSNNDKVLWIPNIKKSKQEKSCKKKLYIYEVK